jgi:hypothetical protein
MGDDGEVDGALFRPYLLTGGRTRSSGDDIPMEALVVTSGHRPVHGLTVEQARIVGACRAPVSIAEIAALLAVPIGVARVLVGDLAGAGHVEVCATVTEADPELVTRLIDGVRST